jgi:hypothetical protein
MSITHFLQVIVGDPGFRQLYREVHALCMRHLDDGADADAVAGALLSNAIRGLMERYGIPQARKDVEDFVRWYFDHAEHDPHYEHLRTRGSEQNPIPREERGQ